MKSRNCVYRMSPVPWGPLLLNFSTLPVLRTKKHSGEWAQSPSATPAKAAPLPAASHWLTEEESKKRKFYSSQF